ncbi:MAG: replication-relaxation family protein [Candidatus Rokubacteria bacterium]|nr:replication-relaxation family protein [Candidatus Rokubacteria bacterium]
MRFLITAQLAQLFFGGSRWATNKRLRKLLDRGLVRVWVRDLARENVYSLDRSGLRLLTAGSEDAAWSLPRGLDGNLDHLLAINDVRISLALGLDGEGGELRSWRSDWELRAHVRAKVVPDALFIVQWDDAEQAFALEVDNATRSPRRFLAKILRYKTLSVRRVPLHGVTDFLTLVVGRDDRWIERYRDAASHTRLGFRILFAALPDVGREGACKSIWKSADGENRYSLHDLARSFGTRSGVLEQGD